MIEFKEIIAEVKGKNTAVVMGSGDLPVLATPALVALMENAAMLVAKSRLEDGDTTVGVQISVNHLKASAVGANVRATATLIGQEGRKFNFELKAYEGDTLIGEGTHSRVSVNAERFMAKL